MRSRFKLSNSLEGETLNAMRNCPFSQADTHAGQGLAGHFCHT